MTDSTKSIVYEFEEVTPYNVIRLSEYRWALQYCEGMRVMDLGCGTGAGSVILSEKAREVVGVDTSHASIEIAKKSNVPDHVSFKLVVEGQLPFEENSFDVIVANNVIERVYNSKELIAKTARILKPGGVLVIATVNRLLRLYFWQKPYNDLHYREYSPISLKQELSRNYRKIQLFGLKTSGTFFPDHNKNLSIRKFRLGVYYPVRNFLRAYVRPILSMILPSIYPPFGSTLIQQVQKSKDVGSFHVEDMDIETASKGITYVQKKIDSCSEILAVCRKS